MSGVQKAGDATSGGARPPHVAELLGILAAAQPELETKPALTRLGIRRETKVRSFLSYCEIVDFRKLRRWMEFPERIIC